MKYYKALLVFIVSLPIILILGAILYVSLERPFKRLYMCAYHSGKNHIAVMESPEWEAVRHTLRNIRNNPSGKSPNAITLFKGDWDAVCPINLSDTTLADFIATEFNVMADQINWQRWPQGNIKNGFGIMFFTYPATAQYFSMTDTGIKLVDGDCVFRRDNPQIGVIKLVEKNTAKYHEYEETKGIYITAGRRSSSE